MFDPILGRADIVAEGNTIKGNWLRARRRYVEENFGADGVEQVAKQLAGDALRYFSEPPLPGSWYPYRPLIEIDYVIARGPFGGDVTRMKEFGKRIADYDLTTLYRAFFKISTPSFVLARTPLIYRMYFKQGEWQVETQRNTATMWLRGGGHPLYMCKHGISGFLEGAAELSGGKNVLTRHVACRHAGAEACCWQLSWS